MQLAGANSCSSWAAPAMGICGSVERFDVKLNVYELGPGNELTTALGQAGMGVFHTGVDINGKEYAFGGSSDAEISPYSTGVWIQQPMQLPEGFGDGARFKETIDMGSFEMTQSHFEKIMRQMKREYTARSYNLMSRNCNHFSNAVCMKLLNKPIPAHLNRLANTGASIVEAGANFLAGMAAALENTTIVVQTDAPRQTGYR